MHFWLHIISRFVIFPYFYRVKICQILVQGLLDIQFNGVFHFVWRGSTIHHTHLFYYQLNFPNGHTSVYYSLGPPPHPLCASDSISWTLYKSIRSASQPHQNKSDYPYACQIGSFFALLGHTYIYGLCQTNHITYMALVLHYLEYWHTSLRLLLKYRYTSTLMKQEVSHLWLVTVLSINSIHFNILLCINIRIKVQWPVFVCILYH